MADRPAACASCAKRLSKKQWYYRNGQYYCSKTCWKTAVEKAATEKAAAEASKAEAPAQPSAS